MNAEEHRQFIEDVRAKFGIQAPNPNVGTPEFLALIVDSYKNVEEGRSLLAGCMTDYLIDHCRDMKDYERLFELADQMVILLQDKDCSYDVVSAARELRSALFWGHLRHGQWDTRKAEAETRLLCALTGANYQQARQADAVLAHGLWNYGPEWDRYMEAEKS